MWIRSQDIDGQCISVLWENIRFANLHLKDSVFHPMASSTVLLEPHVLNIHTFLIVSQIISYYCPLSSFFHNNHITSFILEEIITVADQKQYHIFTEYSGFSPHFSAILMAYVSILKWAKIIFFKIVFSCLLSKL